MGARTVIGLVSLALLLGCASTRITSTFVDPDFDGPPFAKPLVVGLGETEGGRAAFEHAVVARLAAEGVPAEASGHLITRAEDVTRESVRGWVERNGYDAVLVTRLVDVQRDTRYQPPTYGGLYGYWGYYGGFVTSPGYVVETTTLVIETTLFDAATGEVVYSAESKTFEPSSRDGVIEELVPLLVDDLVERELLAARN